MRKLAIVNFIHSFFNASLIIAMPLYLLYRGINVEEIGIILSIAPIAFLTIRTALAVFADMLGTRLFFMGSSVFQSISSLVYMLASSPLLFGAGKFLEGTTYSFFWAVNRTKVMEGKEFKDITLAKLISIRMVAAVLGIGAAGFLISISFDTLFQLLIAAGILSFLISLFFHDKAKKKAKPKAKEMLNLRKGKRFWETAFAIMFIMSSLAILFTFLMPLYLSTEMGLGYSEVGLLMMLFYLGIAVGSYSAIQLGMKESTLLLFQDITIPLIIFIPIAQPYIAPLLMLIGFGIGVSLAMQEETIVQVIERSRYVSTDVALLIAPGRIAEFIALASSGFILVLFGSFGLFILSALLFACFIYFSRDVLTHMPSKLCK
jgi:MFS family permease